jgi:hypothetical protein
MNSLDFRKQLVAMVKASAQEVIDRAEDLVGNGDLLSDFDIWLRFPTNGRMLTGCPTIEVSKSYCSKNCLDVLLERSE